MNTIISMELNIDDLCSLSDDLWAIIFCFEPVFYKIKIPRIILQKTCFVIFSCDALPLVAALPIDLKQDIGIDKKMELTFRLYDYYELYENNCLAGNDNLVASIGNTTNDAHSDGDSDGDSEGEGDSSDSDSDTSQCSGGNDNDRFITNKRGEIEFLLSTIKCKMFAWVNISRCLELDSFRAVLSDIYEAYNFGALVLLLNIIDDLSIEQVYNEMPLFYFRKLMQFDPNIFPDCKFRKDLIHHQSMYLAGTDINNQSICIKSIIDESYQPNKLPDHKLNVLTDQICSLTYEEVDSILRKDILRDHSLFRMINYTIRGHDLFNLRILIWSKLTSIASEVHSADLMVEIMINLPSLPVEEMMYWYAELIYLFNKIGVKLELWAIQALIKYADWINMEKFNMIENIVDLLCYTMDQEDEHTMKEFVLRLARCFKKNIGNWSSPFSKIIFSKILASNWFKRDLKLLFLNTTQLDENYILIYKVLKEDIYKNHADDMKLKIALFESNYSSIDKGNFVLSIYNS
jgi:hypothetical protein